VRQQVQRGDRVARGRDVGEGLKQQVLALDGEAADRRAPGAFAPRQGLGRAL